MKYKNKIILKNIKSDRASRIARIASLKQLMKVNYRARLNMETSDYFNLSIGLINGQFAVIFAF